MNRINKTKQHAGLCFQYGPRQAKNAFEHAQSVRIHIIMYVHKVSSGHLLAIETSCLQSFSDAFFLRIYGINLTKMYPF